MLDATSRQIASERISIESVEQLAALNDELRMIASHLSTKGMFSSSVYVDMCNTAATEAIRSRVQSAWLTYHRVMSTVGQRYSVGLANDLKDAIGASITIDDIVTSATKLRGKMGGPSVQSHGFEGLLTDALHQALRKTSNEIELYVLSLKEREAAVQSNGTPQTFHIYSPVGSIQTGANSTANVTMTIQSDDKARILEALRDLSDRIPAASDMTEREKTDALELINESKIEVQRSMPNFQRLRAILFAAGTSVQTAASIRPAYELLKQALVFVGVVLP